MRTWHLRKHKGSALLTALFIMTLVAIAATAMTLRLKVDIAKMQIAIEANLLENKAQLPMFLGLEWLLKIPLPATKKNGDPAILTTFSHLTKERGWQISGEIIDLQSRFNLNNLINKSNEKLLEKLLSTNGISQSRAKQITRLCHYSIQRHHLGKGKDKLLEKFLEQKPPYYPSFQPFTSPSELRLIPGVSNHVSNKILPLVSTLPVPTPINILTAPPEIIKILGDGLNESQVNRILEMRKGNGLNNINKLNEVRKQYNIPANQVSLESKYFLIISKVSHLENYLQQFTIVERRQSRDKKKVKLNIIYVSYHSL